MIFKFFSSFVDGFLSASDEFLVYSFDKWRKRKTELNLNIFRLVIVPPVFMCTSDQNGFFFLWFLQWARSFGIYNSWLVSLYEITREGDTGFNRVAQQISIEIVSKFQCATTSIEYKMSVSYHKYVFLIYVWCMLNGNGPMNVEHAIYFYIMQLQYYDYKALHINFHYKTIWHEIRVFLTFFVVCVTIFLIFVAVIAF